MHRRTFLAGTAAAAAALATTRRSRAKSANDKIVLAIMGVNNRGSQLAASIAKRDGAEIAYICDCDETAVPKGIKAATSQGAAAPKVLKDFRRALDDKNIDALICAAPNHWHAPATILACAAGKHVYSEKPASHTADEGERMIAAARTANRVVQIGLQRRSNPMYGQMIEKVQGGAIGRVLYARSTYFNNRPSIGHGHETSPPATLDYNLWQGAAIAQPYRDNIIPYNWHNFWHWGNGELGNNGIHTIDVCRWALGVDYPTHVTASGAKLRYDDDQQTPDTCTVTANYSVVPGSDRVVHGSPDPAHAVTLVWEGISWSPAIKPASGINIELRGENGAILADDRGYKIFDIKGKQVETHDGAKDEAHHLANFLDCIRSDKRPNCDIEIGHKSTMICHLGNIAYRTGQSVDVDSTTGRIKNNPAANKLWACEYRKGWLPGV
jgi:predicted dehydrogenase